MSSNISADIAILDMDAIYIATLKIASQIGQNWEIFWGREPPPPSPPPHNPRVASQPQPRQILEVVYFLWSIRASPEAASNPAGKLRRSPEIFLSFDVCRTGSDNRYR